MGIHTLSSIKSQLAGGSKPNLFNVVWTSPSGIALTLAESHSYLCKATSIPEYTLGMIEVPFRGRRIKVPGDRTFGQWSATFINDSALGVRGTFEAWLKGINDTDFSTADRSATMNAYTYMADITVQQLDDTGSDVYSTTLFGAYPVDISTVDLSYDSTDTISEFTVTFNYQYHE